MEIDDERVALAMRLPSKKLLISRLFADTQQIMQLWKIFIDFHQVISASIFKEWVHGVSDSLVIHCTVVLCGLFPSQHIESAFNFKIEENQITFKQRSYVVGPCTKAQTIFTFYRMSKPLLFGFLQGLGPHLHLSPPKLLTDK